MHITVGHLDNTDILPGVFDILPEGASAWMSGNDVVVYDGDVEIARIPVGGLSPEEAAAKVEKELQGVK